jgi:hypothetical protein
VSYKKNFSGLNYILYTDISIWKNVNDAILEHPPVSLRFQQIEELFKLKPPISPISNREPKKDQLTNLLDSKRSLAINIFLKQFSKCSMQEIIDRLRRCDQKMTLEHLRCLEKLLPEPDEVLVCQYDFENFCLQLFL